MVARQRGKRLAEDGGRLVLWSGGVLVACAALWALTWVLYPFAAAMVSLGIAVLLAEQARRG